MDTNPYSAPQSELEGVTASAPEGAEADRRAHISVEGALKGIGGLFILGGASTFLGLVGMVLMLGGALVGGGSVPVPGAGEAGILAVLTIFYAILGLAQVWIGLGLRRRNPAVRIPASILAGLSLLSIPIGTALGGYLLWSIWSAKGKRVFAPDYQAVIDATPHVVQKTSAVAWAALGIIVLGVGGLFAFLMVA